MTETKKKYSTRTQYRQKRIQLVKDSITLLVELLTLEKRYIESIKLPFFKKLKSSIEQRRFE